MGMDPISMSTERLRHLLQEVHEQQQGYRICNAEDLMGPGGGIYIAAKTEIEERHLDWLDRRNPSAGPTYLDVVFLRGEAKRGEAVDLDLRSDEAVPGRSRRERAEHHSRQVVTHAQTVAKQAEDVYKAVGKLDFNTADLRKGTAEAGLREFEGCFKSFRGVVKRRSGNISAAIRW